MAADGDLVVLISAGPALANKVIGTLRPDLMLLDSHINEKDRWEVWKEIKKQDPYLRATGLSPYAGYQEDLRRSLADVYGIQSFHLEGLRQKVAAVLQPKTGNSCESQIKDNPPT